MVVTPTVENKAFFYGKRHSIFIGPIGCYIDDALNLTIIICFYIHKQLNIIYLGKNGHMDDFQQ